MKKRYMLSILITLCLLIVACVGATYAKYASEEKAEKLFSLSSNVQLKTYTYAVLDEATGALSIRNRPATVGGGKLIESSGVSYDLSQVYSLPGDEFADSTPTGAELPWTDRSHNLNNNSNNNLLNNITSVTVEDDITLVSADVTTWFQSLTNCTKLDLAKLTLSADTTFTSSYISNSTALTDLSLPYKVTAIGDNCFQNFKQLQSVTLPDSVTSIGKAAFYTLTALTTVNLGANVKTIDVNAFSGCTALTTVGLEGNTKLETIKESAFQNCKSLETIYLTDNIQTLGGHCFSGCEALTYVHIPQNLERIEQNLFYGCVNLTVDTKELIPETVTFIGGNAFSNCSKITAKVTIWENVSTLGYQAFSGCSSITEISLPNKKISTCGGSVFEGTGVIEVTIPSKLFNDGRVRSKFFKDCKNLTTVTIAEGISYIDEEAFSGCENITEINIPDTVTIIGNKPFYNVDKIFPLTLSETVRTVGNKAFGSDDGSLRVIFYNGTAVGPESWGNVIVVNSENLGGVPTYNNPAELNGDNPTMNITLPAGVDTAQLLIRIGQNTADGFASNSTELVTKNADGTFDIPVTDITKNLIVLYPMETFTYAALGDDGELVIRTGKAQTANGKLFEEDGTVYDLANVFALACDNYRNLAPEGAQLTWVNSEKASEIKSILVETQIQPDNVDGWFTNLANCASMDLANLTLPGTTTLTADLFTGSDAIAELSVPGNVTAIGDNCFFKNDKTGVLRLVTLPEGVTSIGKNAFRYCTKLESINLTDNLTSIGTYCFDGCTSLSQIHISENLTTISEGAFRSCANMTLTSPYILPPNLETLGGQAFYSCSSITVTVDENFFPDSLTTIGNQAFQGCTAITGKLVLPNRAIMYGTYTFAGIGISEVVIPDSCVLSGRMFKDCSALTTVHFPEGITDIPVGAFQECRALVNFTLPSSLKSIGAYAFIGCPRSSIVVPDSVETIGEAAFQGTSIRAIFYNGSATGAPWSMTKGLVINYAKIGTTPPTYVSGLTDSSAMVFEMPENSDLTALLIQNTTEGTSVKVQIINGRFEIPHTVSGNLFMNAGDCITLSEAPVEYAVYSDSTKTLYFLNDILIEVGDPIPGTDNDTPTAVYTDIQGSELFGTGNDWIASYAANIEIVRFLGDIAPINMANWFKDCVNLTDIYGMAEHLDTSNVLSMDYAFAGCEKLTELDLSGFDTKKVQGMSHMFSGCSNLETIYASEMFVTPNNSLDNPPLFEGCEKLVGGNDTAFSSTKTDHTYAWIDGRDGQPGYFTGMSETLIVTDDAQLTDAIAANTDYIVEGGTYSGTVSAVAVNVTVNNAVFKDVTKANAMAVSGGGTLVVNNVDDTENPDRATIASVSDGTLTIESGKFAAQALASGDINGTVIIKGGTFTVSYINGLMGLLYKVGTIEIYGGTFNVNPSEYVADGYTAVDNGVGTWTVQQVSN